MTLVVASTNGSQIGIVSDTQLTQADTQSKHADGVIKSCILPGGLCVSFCNSPELAARAFTQFQQLYPMGTGYSDAIEFFADSSSKTGNDYILAFAASAKLISIREGTPQKTLAKTIWIGDQSARERFLEYFHKKRKPIWSDRAITATMFDGETTESPVHNLLEAMRMLIADPEITSVGGFLTALSSNGREFNFCAYASMFYDNASLWVGGNPTMISTGENQEFAYASVKPMKPGINLTGFHIVKPKLTYLFTSDDNGLANKCRIIKDIVPMELNAYCRQEFGIDFDIHCFAVEAANPSVMQLPYQFSNLNF